MEHLFGFFIQLSFMQWYGLRETTTEAVSSILLLWDSSQHYLSKGIFYLKYLN